jgi:hypothetical protein
MFDDKGTSLLFIHSDKGKNIFNSIKGGCIVKPVDVNTAAGLNRHDTYKIPKQRKKFFGDLDILSWEMLVDKYVGNDTDVLRGYKLIRSCFGKIRRFILS